MPYSIIDNSVSVDHDHWVVSIVRKPKGKNAEHASLIVEGQNDFGKMVLRRYDLFLDENSSENNALIYIKPEVIVNAADAEKAVLETLLNGEAVYALAWPITREKARSLHEDILRDKSNPPHYQVSGNKSLIAKSSSDEGHSCFTWAREKLYNLDDDKITLPEKYGDFIAAKTSRYIRGNPETSPQSCLVM